MFVDESVLRTVSLIGLVLIGLTVWAYVSFRTAKAARRGEDRHAARWSALEDALPVAGAGMVGLYIFLGTILLIGLVLFISLFEGSLFSHSDEVGNRVTWIFAGGMTALFGFPLVTAAVVVVVKRRRR